MCFFPFFLLRPMSVACSDAKVQLISCFIQLFSGKCFIRSVFIAEKSWEFSLFSFNSGWSCIQAPLLHVFSLLDKKRNGQKSKNTWHHLFNCIINSWRNWLRMHLPGYNVGGGNYGLPSGKCLSWICVYFYTFYPKRPAQAEVVQQRKVNRDKWHLPGTLKGDSRLIFF